jgi:hypothetical protein
MIIIKHKQLLNLNIINNNKYYMYKNVLILKNYLLFILYNLYFLNIY